ncbi:MAG: hypothetical protein IJY17_00925 [Alphaproteobacteria bacterium]|nr:hypothetical protein [Alphaproteobacteria bacterium]
MSDLVNDFLDEAQGRLSELESLFPLLEKNPADEKVWTALDSFFGFVRSVAPFAGFMRAYRLSDAGMAEIKGYLSQKSNMTALPAVLMKFQRIKKILAAAVNLKREPRESDDDLLPAAAVLSEERAAGENVFQGPVFVPPDLTAQEAALDEREEQLVLWAQALTEQDAALKQKENVLFEEERRQALSQEKIAAVMARLNEQEKLQTDLEDHLAETRLALQNCQEKLADQENQQEQALHLLETKNEALNEMSRKIQDLTRLLGEKENLSEQREEQLYRELQQNHRQAEELRINLKALEDFRSEISEDHRKMSSQYETLEKEYQDALSRLDIEKENTELMLKEKRELEKQHIEFNTRFIALQENLNAEKENLKRTQKALEQQKRRNDFICGELKAAAWPYNAEKIQKELAVLARRGAAQQAGASLSALKDLVGSIRTRSFMQIPFFLQKTAQKAAKKYQRRYQMEIDSRIESGIDKDAAAVLEQILSELIDNAFHYAFPDENEELTLRFSAREEGAFIHVSFSDNGSSFDFDKLYSAVQAAGLTDAGAALTRNDLPVYLFHSSVKFHEERRGLTTIGQLLEKSGGQIRAVFENGLCLYFSVPKKFLFDRVLIFGQGGSRFALPLNAVAETVFLRESEFGIRTQDGEKNPFFYWKGLTLPILNFTGQEKAETPNYGLVVQSGIFCALIPVQQIFDTEQLLSFSEKNTGTGLDYLIFCTVLESGREIFWIDLAKLWEQAALPIPKKIVSVSENAAAETANAGMVSYLVFKSEPSVFGAVRVDGVLRVEDFSFPPASLVHKKYFETQGRRLPLKDSCPRDSYPYAQAVLIFDSFALAIQEVVDLIDIPGTAADSGAVDFIVYRGRKVPVFSAQDQK